MTILDDSRPRLYNMDKFIHTQTHPILTTVIFVKKYLIRKKKRSASHNLIVTQNLLKARLYVVFIDAKNNVRRILRLCAKTGTGSHFISFDHKEQG